MDMHGEMMNNDVSNSLLKMDRNEYATFMYDRFPDLFRPVPLRKPDRLGLRHRGLRRGFEIGCGWYLVIYEMCLLLQNIYDKLGVRVEFIQIKEKFAGGRIYYDICYDRYGYRTIQAILRKLLGWLSPILSTDFADHALNFIYPRVQSLLADSGYHIEQIVTTTENRCYHTDEITGQYISGPIIKNGWHFAMSEETFAEHIMKVNSKS